MGGRVNNVCGWGAGKRRAFVQPSSLDNVFDMCIRQASGSDRESNGVGGWEGHAGPFCSLMVFLRIMLCTAPVLIARVETCAHSAASKGAGAGSSGSLTGLARLTRRAG